ncbi:hypothetical protein QJS82_05080 [Psychrobacter maritimus]|uniref:hypothetical protein n=1 Tax=Psychrobacter maritimus TaxID=256325 RepID=UPI00248B7FD5|nr:hypothetical protein [Psychrobacter sp. WB2]WGV14045.1 hypothetical protein QJS82_05080 [Psychrobacter sp. WB2]
MKPMYYTTSEIKKIFGWVSTATVQRKRDSGFLPEPNLKGKPNKWLRSVIDDIIEPPKNNKESED